MLAVALFAVCCFAALLLCLLFSEMHRMECAQVCTTSNVVAALYMLTYPSSLLNKQNVVCAALLGYLAELQILVI